MKAKYLKPTTEINLLDSPAIMLSGSGEGLNMENGGSTSGSGITSGDSRQGGSLWDDEDDEW